ERGDDFSDIDRSKWTRGEADRLRDFWQQIRPGAWIIGRHEYRVATHHLPDGPGLQRKKIERVGNGHILYLERHGRRILKPAVKTDAKACHCGDRFVSGAGGVIRIKGKRAANFGLQLQ